MNKYFITTAIPYINAKAHIGHVQEFLLADTLKRSLASQGYDVLLQSGTDDNSLKNIESAKKNNVPLEYYLRTQGDKFKDLLSKINVEHDLFVQTSHINHHRAVKEFIDRINPEDLYIKNYEGLYCSGCEDFIKEKELSNGVCQDHLSVPKTIKEENVFFKLSKYQKQIYEVIDKDIVKINPSFRKKEILNFISQGLEDISISRPKEIEGFGVDFPNKEDQIVYVWIDALVNYLTGLGLGSNDSWQKEWDSRYKVHVIGKNVWKFHAIYWIGLLLSTKISLPNEILIHGFLTSEGVKISKSLGNGIDLEGLLKNNSSGVIRSYLIGKLNYEQDSDFSVKDLDKFYLEEIVHQIGNVFPRVFTLAKNNHYNLKLDLPKNKISLNSIYLELLKEVQLLNKEINDSKIWKSEDLKKNIELIKKWNTSLNYIASLLIVLVPEKRDSIRASFNEKTIIFNKNK